MGSLSDERTIKKAGQALYGPSWQSDIARDLDVDPRTVRRWAAGDCDVPAGVWKQLSTLCRTRGKALDKLGALLEYMGDTA